MRLYKSRYMQELTWREVKEYLRKSDIVIVPVGSNEVHGALLPQGSDTFVAQAVSLKLAEKIDALIAPPIIYTYSGGTKNIPGAISIPSEVVNHYLEAVILELIRNKFRRIYIIQWHAPYYSHQQLTRELFEKTNIPVVFFGMVSMPVVSNLNKELLKGKCQETAVVSAAMKILGKEDLLDISVESKDQKIKERPEDNILQIIYEKGGVVGHYYSHESQHVAFRKELNTKAGLAIIEAIVKEIAGTAGNIKKYIKILQGK